MFIPGATHDYRIPDRRNPAVPLLDLPLTSLTGQPTSLREVGAETMLIVNVASKCGLTPQYEGLERLQERYAGQGFSVVGFPSNQFGGQEPGTAEEIAEFCSATYGVTFPMMAKSDVNGPDRNAVYQELTAVPDAAGDAGDIQWNFEKFLVSGGQVVARFRPRTEPESAVVTGAIEAALK
jgi:glutathione peroxidase